MKKKKLLIIVLLFITITMTGCTKILKTEEKKAVSNPVTGQSLTENVLCKPKDKETLKLYKKYEVKIDELPECEEFRVTSGGYEGIWTTIFVKPLAWFIIKIGKVTKNYGFAIIIITLLIRLIMVPVTKKTAMQSENLQKAKPELDKLEKKYNNKTDQESMMQKSQEMLMIYKKYDINPMSGCIFSLIQIPLFFAFYEALNRLPVIFEENLGPFQLGTSPLVALKAGNYYYLIFVVLVVLTTYFSFKLNSGASMNKDQADQMKTMTNVMVIMISVMSFGISTGIALYWIFNSGFTVLQNLYVKRSKLNAK
ncbi:MAG: YidC/Oxa1 family membrane protein insertase [Firmicutes bacterium]|nr:YidC/Oxa1 family membrane protein insertase [Bacillota bacterium]